MTIRRRLFFWRGLARAFGGAVIFALPMLMTMEMWWLGFYMDAQRLTLLILINVPLLVGLSHFVGFEYTPTLIDDIRDAFIAYAVAIAAAAAILLLIAVLRPGMPTDEIVGKIILQAIPGSIGAMLARSQLGSSRADQDKQETADAAFERRPYYAELFLMAVGALFLALNVAPTEEMILIAFQMTPWHSLALLAVTLAATHAFVYASEFAGQPSEPPDMPVWSVFLRMTIAGYLIGFLVSLFTMWTFGRLDDLGIGVLLQSALVLAFPAALGAAAARLIV